MIIRADAHAQEYSSTLSAESLRDATDQHGKKLLNEDAPCDKIAEKLHQLNASFAHLHAARDYALSTLVLEGRPGIRVKPGGSGGDLGAVEEEGLRLEAIGC